LISGKIDFNLYFEALSTINPIEMAKLENAERKSPTTRKHLGLPRCAYAPNLIS
jgi:hypothetical protein